MNRKEFLQQLEKGLSGLKPEAVREILSDYEEYFNDAAAAGRSEADVVEALGHPQKLARELKAQSHYKAWEQRPTLGNLGRVVVSIAGLGLLNFILFIPFMIYLALLTTGYFLSVGFLLGGLAVVLAWGGHGLFGWPQMQDIHDFQVGFHDAASEESGPVGDKAHIDKGRWQLSLDDGDSARLVGKNGEPVLLSKQDDQLKVDASSAEGKALVRVDADGDASVDVAKLKALTLTGAGGDTLEWSDEQGSKSLHARSTKGSEVMLAASGDHGEVRIKDGGDTFHIIDGHMSMKSGSSNVDMDVIPGLGMIGTLAVIGIGLLLAGALGLVFCVWLTRLTWRGLVGYVRYQIALVAGRE